MKARVTPIALVVLAVGTAAYAYFVDADNVSDADRAARRADVFPSFRVEKVERIELVHGPEKLVLRRHDGAPSTGGVPPAWPRDVWQMTEPRDETADVSAVDALLRELEMASRVRDVQESDAVGLEAPRVRGSVTIGPLEYRFAVGGDAATPEGAAYMRVDGEGTFVIGRTLKVQLLRGANAYRERALVPYGSSDIARVEVEARGSRGVVLERSSHFFRVGSATGLRASSVAVDHLLGAVAGARADAFLDAAVADHSPADAVTVIVTPAKSSLPRVRLRVGGRCPAGTPSIGAVAAGESATPGIDGDVVVARMEPAPLSACVSKELAEALAVTSTALVDAAPFSARADEIEELQIERVSSEGGQAAGIDLARRGGGWHERAPQERDLTSGEVDSADTLVSAIAGARALDVRHAEPGEHIGSHARVTVVRTGTEAREVVEVGAAEADGIALAKRLDDGAILRLSRPVARRFEPHPIALESHAVWQAPVDPAEVQALDDSCGAGTQQLELQGGVWTSRAFRVDAASAGALVAAFSRAKADAWIAESDDGGFGFDHPDSCKVTLTLNPVSGDVRPRRIGLVFGDRGEGGVYAHALDAPGVFVAPAALRDGASRPAVDASRFRIEPAGLTRVILRRGGATVALSRSSDGRLVRTDVDGSASDDPLEAALTSFGADFAVHAGPPSGDEEISRPTLEIELYRALDGGAASQTHITIGAPTRVASDDGYYARVTGVDATFLVLKRAVTSILEAW